MREVARITPVVLAGGRGERLWPLSTAQHPKQFTLKAPTGRSLFQETILRVADCHWFEPPVVITNRSYKASVARELHAIDHPHATVIYEPHARNTAPAIALAALHLAEHDPHAIMLVVPSDHHIDAPEKLLEALPMAVRAASEGYIVTFAMRPTAPETGYGYIKKGEVLKGLASVHGIAQFIEKPDAANAQTFMAHGGYGWNSGMFLMRAATALDEARQHAPKILAACKHAHVNRTGEGTAFYPEAQAFEQCPSIAFDRAVMEHTKHGAVIDVAMGWRDLGSWEALAAHAMHLKNHPV
mgnify:CR=1 FL=1